MNSNPLVPTPIVDKNGRQTTVHRRAGETASSIAIPAPVMMKQDLGNLSPYELRKLVSDIDKKSRYGSVGRSTGLVKAVLTEYPEELLLRIQEVQRDEPENVKLVNFLIMEAVSANEVSEMIHFAPLMTRGTKLFVAQNFLRSLHHYPQLPVSVDYGKEPDEVRSKAEAVVRISDAMFSYVGVRMFRGLGSTIDNEELIDLVVENPDKADLIASVMKQRKITDAGILRAVMEADSLPLSEGVL